MDQVIVGFLSNFGFFAPVAGLGWWVIKTLRSDLMAERDQAQEQLKEAIERNNVLTDRVIALAQSVEKTMGELTAAIRGPVKS